MKSSPSNLIGGLNLSSNDLNNMIGPNYINSSNNSGRNSVNSVNRLDTVEDDFESYAVLLSTGNIRLNP